MQNFFCLPTLPTRRRSDPNRHRRADPPVLRFCSVRATAHHPCGTCAIGPNGVLVNTVAPCITETESRKNILERPGYKEWATQDMIPRGRWNQPEDLVGAVLFLSSYLSDMVVGHTLMVDGGWTIH